ncbi:FHA domain-containing protein [Nocardia sp. ET3-3]|uniref:FHA domain-containing protein n=1 Tax=Nocardia terrae TaxID=2675851 RepID=A0A7K1UTQ2_9NOCA|nr:FHA domain-containing protein [Nocardia terrae]MVU77742.1 FHA domain-containing protein [Nocardia terrae]
MLTCPAGHESAADDYCDVCGLLMGASPAPAATPEPAGTPCPVCGEPQTGRFCEGCSYDFVAGSAPTRAAVPDPTVVATPVKTAWTATVFADREYFDTMRSEDDDVEFPAYCPERVFSLRGTQIRVGRHSASKGIDPEIDLTGPPQDPGISHLHVLLLAQPGNGWAVLDLGSTNGTRLNAAVDPIPRGETVPVHAGDRIHLGAWTTLTLEQDNAS